MSLVNPIWMASGIVSVAIFLGLWQWFDRRARGSEMDLEDRQFFRNQDIRRGVGIIAMGLLAVTIALVPLGGALASTRAQVLWQTGVVTALVVLILTLLVLALLDWMATHRYARRHRRELADEHSKLMLEVIRRAGSSEKISRMPENEGQAPEV